MGGGGGWRNLRSEFDFIMLMKSLNDPWAGREWLFSIVKKMMMDIGKQQPMLKHNAKFHMHWLLWYFVILPR